MINDRINLLSGRSSTGYALVTAIKTVAILFVIILAVQGVFHLPYYFCGLCGYFVVVSCVNITLMKIWVIFKWVLCFIWNVFPEPIRAIRSCLRLLVTRLLFFIFLEWKKFLATVFIVQHSENDDALG